jgi:predicted DNA-binding protein with PD1-like motif
MKSKLISDQGTKTFVVVLSTGDEVAESLLTFAREKHLSASQLTAIGAFSDVTLGYFDWEQKDYKKLPFREQLELLSLIGDVSLDENGKAKVHSHVVLGRADGSTLGGHLLEAHVRPTLEVIVTESPAHLQRHYDSDSKLGLIQL